jgi:hypothetical protein
MGFFDPFALRTSFADKENESILWLDLNPKFQPNSTRGFLVGQPPKRTPGATARMTQLRH